MWPIYNYGTEAQREKYLPKLASGEWVGAFGLTEPDHGSDPGGMKTRAKKVDGGYQLNGAKMWISNAPLAQVFVVWAKDDDDVIRGFILERGMEGLTTPKLKNKLSLRASTTGRSLWTTCLYLTRTGCRKRAALVGRSAASTTPGTGSPGAPSVLPNSCWKAAREYALDRTQFGKLLHLTSWCRKLADMQTDIFIGLQSVTDGSHDGRRILRAGAYFHAET